MGLKSSQVSGRVFDLPPIAAMAPKAMKGKAMTKGGLAEALAGACELKKSHASKVIDALASVASAELKKNSVFTVPGLCRVKTRVKPATKAGKREMFGKVTIVKAKPAKTVVKAFAVAALKNQF